MGSFRILIGLESACKRNRNNLERSRRPDLPSFRRNAARTACKRHAVWNEPSLHLLHVATPPGEPANDELLSQTGSYSLGCTDPEIAKYESSAAVCSRVVNVR